MDQHRDQGKPSSRKQGVGDVRLEQQPKIWDGNDRRMGERRNQRGSKVGGRPSDPQAGQSR